ncbi:MAG: hypothetical protein ACI85I_000494 [Arenicella sp.]|jgi:hypothetical protein
MVYLSQFVFEASLAVLRWDKNCSHSTDMARFLTKDRQRVLSQKETKAHLFVFRS